MLEPITVIHADEIIGVLSDPVLYEFTGGAPLELAELRLRYESQSRGYSLDESERWWNWLVRETASGEAAGYVQATMTVVDRVIDVAWVVGTKYQRRGYAKEASAAMVGWLRANLDRGGAMTFTAHVLPDHQASNAVARSLGLRPSETIIAGEVRWVST
jgi:RimJ/RimL family protein N-acetyltransferase